MQTNNINQKMNEKRKYKWTGLVMTIMLIGFLAAGCNGSSGSSTDAGDNSSSLLEGTFVDSPVQGLDYYSDTHSGVTDENGHFMYQEGEMMSFAIGDVILGEAMAREVMTPLDFIDESEMPFDETHPTVTNMGRFLQSLDTDGNPENGIMISQGVRDEVNGRMIDFHQSIMDFESDPDTEALFDTLNGLNMPHNGMMWALETVEDAQQHMDDHLGEYMDRYMMDDDTMGPGSGMDDPMGDGDGFGMGDGAFMDDDAMGPGTGMDDPMGDDMGPGMGDDDFMNDDTMGPGSAMDDSMNNDTMGPGSGIDDPMGDGDGFGMGDGAFMDDDAMDPGTGMDDPMTDGTMGGHM